MGQPLKLLSTEVVDELSKNVEQNLEKYRYGDFSDNALKNGWALEANSTEWDPAIADLLLSENTPEAEFKNSLIIFKGLKGMTPALARDERIWTRLCHVECIGYARRRWLRGDENLAKQVKRHFFAPGFPGCRDDNAIGRLWWNGHVASLAFPKDMEAGLKRLLARANNRLQIVERADTAFRQPLVGGVVRLLENEWFKTNDQAIASFMLEVNKRSGGVVFEALKEEEIDAHLLNCLELAKSRHAE